MVTTSGSKVTLTQTAWWHYPLLRKRGCRRQAAAPAAHLAVSSAVTTLHQLKPCKANQQRYPFTIGLQINVTLHNYSQIKTAKDLISVTG